MIPVRRKRASSYLLANNQRLAGTSRIKILVPYLRRFYVCRSNPINYEDISIKSPYSWVVTGIGDGEFGRGGRTEGNCLKPFECLNRDWSEGNGLKGLACD